MVISEHTAPDAADMGRNYRRASAFDNPLETGLETQQIAVPGHVPFRENTQHVPVPDGVAGLAYSSSELLGRVVCGYRYCPAELTNWFKP